MGINPLAGFNELRARAADDAHERMVLIVRAELIRRLHKQVPCIFLCDADHCSTCGGIWPCRTRRILDGLDGDDWGEGPP